MLDKRENSNQFLTKKDEHVILFLQWYVWFKNVVKLFLKYNVFVKKMWYFDPLIPFLDCICS